MVVISRQVARSPYLIGGLARLRKTRSQPFHILGRGVVVMLRFGHCRCLRATIPIHLWICLINVQMWGFFVYQFNSFPPNWILVSKLINPKWHDLILTHNLKRFSLWSFFFFYFLTLEHIAILNLNRTKILLGFLSSFFKIIENSEFNTSGDVRFSLLWDFLLHPLILVGSLLRISCSQILDLDQCLLSFVTHYY